MVQWEGKEETMPLIRVVGIGKEQKSRYKFGVPLTLKDAFRSITMKLGRLGTEKLL